MTVTALPFQAVLLVCPVLHYEATLDSDWRTYEQSTCRTCGRRLALVKTVTIWPGGRR